MDNINVNNNKQINLMKELIKQIKSQFPFNPLTDCREKYNETIQDYLYEEIIYHLQE
jgi:hypothetical protein